MSLTYKSAGVDIAAGEQTVKNIKPLVRSTFGPRVLADIGHFGGFFDAKFDDYAHPVLVASADGVGTKLKIAFASAKHDTVGQCLVNHCVNDILCCGARPLFFLDYFATGKLDPAIATEVISGFAVACRENGCALIGGETAEMPSIYADGEYDMSGTIVGIVDKNKIVDGKTITKGDFLIALPSSGLHTNGYSLARAVLLEKFQVGDRPDILGGKSISEALLAVHRSYLHVVSPLLEKNLLKGISHITGGGIVGNTSRILPEGRTLEIDWNSWEMPAIFELIRTTGNIADEEMRKAFNLGVGMLLVVSPENKQTVIDSLSSSDPFVIGTIG